MSISLKRSQNDQTIKIKQSSIRLRFVRFRDVLLLNSLKIIRIIIIQIELNQACLKKSCIVLKERMNELKQNMNERVNKRISQSKNRVFF